jgi:ABC-type transporter Mla MlaB component
VIRIEGTTRDGLRIIGALTGTVLRRMLAMTGAAEVVLDLSEVIEADAANVRLLSRIADGHCRLVNCPRWLALWIDRERRPAPPVDGS